MVPNVYDSDQSNFRPCRVRLRECKNCRNRRNYEKCPGMLRAVATGSCSGSMRPSKKIFAYVHSRLQNWIFLFVSGPWIILEISTCF